MLDMSHWQPPQRRIMPRQLVPWLLDRGSLTRRLKNHSEYDFNVRLLAQNWAKPLVDECLVLSVPLNQLAYQREVLLMDGQNANVYARTIVPAMTYQVMPSRFNQLGTQPLGELLFTDPQVKRGPMQVACLKPSQWLYEMAVIADGNRPRLLWGRRSLFFIDDRPLLVNEIFLPNLLRR